jgi:hypothetical protein
METRRDEKKQRTRAMPLEVGGKGKDDRRQKTEDRRQKTEEERYSPVGAVS